MIREINYDKVSLPQIQLGIIEELQRTGEKEMWFHSRKYRNTFIVTYKNNVVEFTNIY